MRKRPRKKKGGGGGGGGGEGTPGEETKENKAEVNKPGRRAAKRERENEPDFVDEEVGNLVLKIVEGDNTVGTREEQVTEEALVKYLQRNVEEMYPHIGEETYRVPDVHINKGKAGESIEEGVTEFPEPKPTDSRSDRAHNLVSEMIYQLSIQLKPTNIGPLFIISSYEYDNFLSRLKAAFEKKFNLKDMKGVNLPKDTGDRGEIDIIVILPKHVIFVEIKAVGDNFEEYATDKEKVTTSTIKKAQVQLVRDEKVFNHVMKDLNLEGFKQTKIMAMPNLERQYLDQALLDKELKETCSDCNFLCKEDIPQDVHNFEKDFHVFKDWWIRHVFPEYKEGLASDILDMQTDKPLQQQCDNTGGCNSKLTPLDEVKVIVGRYVGFMSVVKVCSTSNSNSRRIEVRRKGQSVSDVGRRFADIVLTNDQKQYLDRDIRLGYLCGPPGSGKTVVLAVKARRWILNYGNYVVVVNMYRGAPGRAIGKQIYRTITMNSDDEKKAFLEQHCIEIRVDVTNFDKEDFLRKVKEKSAWGNDIGPEGEKIMFLVDETYVQSYWDSVFSTLRGNFNQSSLWCAGLYGKQPAGFESLELKQVIRCPPTVQEILLLIDWDEKRRGCYITDATQGRLPTNGPHVQTLRHQEHWEYASLPPSQCLICGEELAKILEVDFKVEKPGKGHTAADLKVNSLKCSDILFLVNMPRSCYTCDENKYLDTTEEKYVSYMESFKKCVMLNKLEEAGYPCKIHKKLSCPDLVSSDAEQVINVTWVYTYQGLENKVIIFIPGDEGMPENFPLEDKYLTDALMNIPCPGLKGRERTLSGKTHPLLSEGSFQRDSSREESEEDSDAGGSGMGEEEVDEPGAITAERGRSDSGHESPKKLCKAYPELKSSSSKPLSSHVSEKEEDNSGQESPGVAGVGKAHKSLSNDDRIFRKEDVDRYTRWDKNNLFISASRCTSQLILITR